MEEPLKKRDRKSQVDHLKPYQFKKGKDWKGNAKGRPPRDKSISDALRRLMSDYVIKGKPLPEALAENLLKRALKHTNDLQVVLDRTEGRVPNIIGFDESMPAIVTIKKIVAHVVEDDPNTTGSGES